MTVCRLLSIPLLTTIIGTKLGAQVDTIAKTKNGTPVITMPRSLNTPVTTQERPLPPGPVKPDTAAVQVFRGRAFQQDTTKKKVRVDTARPVPQFDATHPPTRQRRKPDTVVVQLIRYANPARRDQFLHDSTQVHTLALQNSPAPKRAAVIRLVLKKDTALVQTLTDMPGSMTSATLGQFLTYVRRDGEWILVSESPGILDRWRGTTKNPE